MEKNIISIIVPVYNVEKYLENSIKSLINQTIFEKLDIILIDDGSTDNSAKICHKFSKMYNNIKFISQKNGGVSSARNLGLDIACGKYITFFDADDLVENNIYEKLLYLIEKNNSSLALVDFSFVYENKEVKKRSFIKKNIKGKKVLLKMFLSGEIISKNLVDKLFRKNLIGNLKFEKDFRVGEDYYFLYNYLKKSESIEIDSTKSLYKYIQHKESTMKSEFSNKYFDTILLSEKILSEYDKNDDLYNFSKAFAVFEKLKVVEYMMFLDKENNYLKQKKEFLKIINDFKILDAYKYLGKKQFLAYLVMRVSPKFYKFLKNNNATIK